MTSFTMKKDMQELYKQACRDDLEFIAYVARDKKGNTVYHMEGEASALDVCHALTSMLMTVTNAAYEQGGFEPIDEEMYDEEEHGPSH